MTEKVNLTSRTTKYTFPADGYLCLDCSGTINDSGAVKLYDANDEVVGAISIVKSGSYEASTVFVRKGMKCLIAIALTGYSNLYYYKF